MNEKMFDKWLKGLGKAWTSKDPDGAANLCAENVVYHEEPMQKPLIGREAVRKEWQNVPSSQKDIDFKYDIISVSDKVGVAHWWAEFTRLPSGERSELDGIYVVYLNEDGLCTQFHQWWNSK